MILQRHCYSVIYQGIYIYKHVHLKCIWSFPSKKNTGIFPVIPVRQSIVTDIWNLAFMFIGWLTIYYILSLNAEAILINFVGIIIYVINVYIYIYIIFPNNISFRSIWRANLRDLTSNGSPCACRVDITQSDA